MVSFQNCLGPLYYHSDREMVKRRFLISNVSAGNVTMCREQQFDREPRVDQAWSDTFKDTRVPLEAHTGFTALHLHLNPCLTVSRFFL